MILNPYRLQSHFVPTDIANLTGWHKADAIVGLNNGDTVTSWTDSLGLTWPLVSVTGTPTYRTNVRNGLPAVRFDGSSSLATAANHQYVGADGQYAVFALFVSTIASGTRGIVSLDRSIATTARNAQLNYTATIAMQAVVFNTANTTFTDTSAATLTTNQWGVASLIRSLTDVEAKLGDVGNGATATTGTPRGVASPLGVGASTTNGSSQFLVGDLIEVLVYSRAPTSGEQSQIVAYLNQRGGL